MQKLGRTISLCELSDVVNEKSIQKMQRSVQLKVAANTFMLVFRCNTHSDIRSTLTLQLYAVCVCVSVVAEACVAFHRTKKFFFVFGANAKLPMCKECTLFIRARIEFTPRLVFRSIFSLLLCTAFFLRSFQR